MTMLEKQNDQRGGFGSGQWLGISERKTNMKKDKNGEVTPVNKWRCETCDSEDMTPEQMKNHLHNKHGIKTEGLKANRSMISHVDGDTWFSWNYRWTFESAKGAVSMEQYTVNRRAKDDMMRYA